MNYVTTLMTSHHEQPNQLQAAGKFLQAVQSTAIIASEKMLFPPQAHWLLRGWLPGREEKRTAIIATENTPRTINPWCFDSDAPYADVAAADRSRSPLTTAPKNSVMKCSALFNHIRASVTEFELVVVPALC
jgi:hypothetical protein